MAQETSFRYLVIVFSIFFLTVLLMETSLTISYSQPIENSMMGSKEGTSTISYNINRVQNNTNEVNHSPLKQTTQGVFLSEVECNTGKVLLVKSSQNRSACVTPQTAIKLIARSWGLSSTTIMLSTESGIKVESFVEQIVTKCKTKTDCIIDSMKKVAENEKKIITLRTYESIIGWYEDSLGYCHGVGHHMGMFLYDYSEDLSEALFNADQLCGGSQYHGIIERYFEKNMEGIDPKNINITKICPEGFANPHSLERWECVHGIGHGLTKFYDYDIFSALKKCDEFGSSWEEISCSKGIFMENVGKWLESKEGNFDKTDIFFPCDSVNPKYAPACYHYHTSYIRSQPNYSLQYAFETCDMIKPKEFVRYCYYGMGRIYTGNSANNFEKAITTCKIGDVNYQRYCFGGIQLTLVDNYGIDKGFEFCKFLPLEFKEDCYEVLGKWILMSYTSNEQREYACAKAESMEYSKVCINSNLENIVFL